MEAVLSGRARSEEGRSLITNEVEQKTHESREHGFDIDTMTEDNFSASECISSPVAMEDLDRIIQSPDLMPEDALVQRLGDREYSLHATGMAEPVRVTTDPSYFEQHPDSLELWSPGNPLFKAPKLESNPDQDLFGRTLRELLDN